MEIWKAQEEESEEELRWATSDEDEGFEQAASPLPSATFRRSPRSGKAKQRYVKRDRTKDPLVYKLTNMVNGMGYVGKAKNSYQRMYEHRTGKKGKSGKLQYVDAAIQKHGWENFKVEWLETNVDAAKLLDREAHWMRQCDTLYPKGYNILKPGVEVMSMSDPVIRARWEAANPAGVLKSIEVKREKREVRLKEMDPVQAEELRYRLDKEAERNRKRYNGEALSADGRYLSSAKRQATWARKLEERLAKMTPEDAKKARARNEAQKKYAQANMDKIMAKNRSPKNQEYQKEYRAANQEKRLKLGRTAETSG
jgi:group I intron endonuclease